MSQKTYSSTRDPKDWTGSALRAEEALKVPIGLMDAFASDSRGRPRKEQHSLYLSAVTFTYAVWESYVEDVSVEVATILSQELSSNKVPSPVREALSGRSAWELSVDPGWRGLWLDEVTSRAKGNPGSGYGLNTASFDNVSKLFEIAGIEKALPDHLSVSAGTRLGAFKNPPSKVAVRKKDSTVDVKHCLQRLISLRGEAVHTASTEETLLKREVLWWTAFIRDLHERVDTLVTEQVDTQLKH